MDAMGAWSYAGTCVPLLYRGRLLSHGTYPDADSGGTDAGTLRLLQPLSCL